MQKENWQPYINLFISLSAWLAGPIIVGLLVGNWLDSRYTSKPWGVLGCIGIAFVVSNIGIAKEAKRMMQQLETESKKKPTPNDTTNSSQPD